MKIHHFGIACENIRKSKKHYEELGFQVASELITDSDRNLDYLFLKNGEILIELISKNDSMLRSDIDIILEQKKIVGNKIYHIGYASTNIELDVINLVQQGYKLIKAPSPAIAVDNRRVAFLIHVDLGVVELVEE